MVMKKIVLLSRKSFLAKIQTHIAEIEINKIQKNIIDTHYSSSVGDTDMSAKAWEQHGFGIFTNSLSKKLILKDADVVVHSFKDLPVKNLNKTSFICLKRDDPRDVILIKKTSLNKKKLVIGTSSPRRKYYLKKLRKFLPFEELKPFDIRGNVPSRLEKILNSSKEDGVFMAKAAIDRILEYEKLKNITTSSTQTCLKESKWMVLPLSLFPSAPAQGAIGIEVANKNHPLIDLVQSINEKETFDNVVNERKIMSKYGGGCSQKIGVSIWVKNNLKIKSINGLTEDGVVLEDFTAISTRLSVPDSSKTTIRSNAFPVAQSEKNIFSSAFSTFTLFR